ncbi:NAD-dependent epimerase/dehydratase family protein [Chitinophaga nivalis]|uniref:NAD-dependent epimerase/dehydratase family protein n=1 Tax=Chitinophaga nivalis TaxID=2991709 RepID=A0ABT3IV21_9BACT|nr:NAD-dependent epimerase/dehydratase family protein [Chitinophaga nivalis]MCW3462462.1 NAD-dependent epimerase/dehydratase family protein [Chitinophaga nivalis]MCW3487847.1 NAD-dependent epimerase/dehydratase family protein [Chitinophaga nivalis]
MILVTGGTGFLGSYLIRSLVDAGKPVRALYRKQPSPRLQDIADKIEWVPGDILDVCALEDAMVGITQVYHCAAVVSFLPADRSRMLRINVEGTANVVNMALDAGVKKLLHVSSVAAIGRAKEGGAINEDCEWEDSKNNSQYSISKLQAEMEVWRGIAEGLDAVMVNPSIILGAGFWEDGSGALIKKAWNEFPFYTEGVNGFVDVRDVVTAMIQLMDSDIIGERFILSADNWSYRQLFTTMAASLQKKPPHIAAKPWMTEAVWRVERLKGLLTGKHPLITRETARTARLKVYYDNNKILQTLPGFDFRPLADTIRDISAAFLKDQSLLQQ